MIEAEMTTEGQQPSELIKKIKQQQTGIIKTVCSKIIEGFYKEFGIAKEVDEEIINRVISEALSKTDGVMEFLACVNYLCSVEVNNWKLTPASHFRITASVLDSQFTLGKDILLDIMSQVSICESTKGQNEWSHYLKLHYLVSKCLDLCVPF